jgi:hypothetical protein
MHSRKSNSATLNNCTRILLADHRTALCDANETCANSTTAQYGKVPAKAKSFADIIFERDPARQ